LAPAGLATACSLVLLLGVVISRGRLLAGCTGIAVVATVVVSGGSPVSGITVLLATAEGFQVLLVSAAAAAARGFMAVG
jgi:hypothetical protein